LCITTYTLYKNDFHGMMVSKLTK